MTGFYEMDLTKLNFDIIPSNYFDGIWMVHVIEHLYNGDEVIKNLLPKLKSGVICISNIRVKKYHAPSMYGTLNFKDDPTHVRLYSVQELSQLAQENNCTVLKKGTRRNVWFMMAMPFRIAASWIKGKNYRKYFWDVLGFADMCG